MDITPKTQHKCVSYFQAEGDPPWKEGQALPTGTTGSPGFPFYANRKWEEPAGETSLSGPFKEVESLEEHDAHKTELRTELLPQMEEYNVAQGS
ncbi:hypothetical protein NDU88_011451 [Pleurodeles waltl]|uniref:Uncharacterized protein n=1 Tax=Pleurodeles waltl TaxID=8319 RepID=A0AAV7R3E7_PLEWA|nr:hypothetical protein NDU88_011451 [Pleurodeles waltl]